MDCLFAKCIPCVPDWSVFAALATDPESPSALLTPCFAPLPSAVHCSVLAEIQKLGRLYRVALK